MRCVCAISSSPSVQSTQNLYGSGVTCSHDLHAYTRVSSRLWFKCDFGIHKCWVMHFVHASARCERCGRTDECLNGTLAWISFMIIGMCRAREIPAQRSEAQVHARCAWTHKTQSVCIRVLNGGDVDNRSKCTWPWLFRMVVQLFHVRNQTNQQWNLRASPQVVCSSVVQTRCRGQTQSEIKLWQKK